MAIKGRIEVPPRRSELEFVIHSIDMLSKLSETRANSLRLKVSTKALDQIMITDLNKIFAENEGRVPVHFTVYDPLDELQVMMPSRSIKVELSSELFKQLEQFDLDVEIK